MSNPVSFRPASSRWAAVAFAAALALPAAASAQGYFIPPQASAPRQQAPAPVARPAPRPAAPTVQALPPPPPVQLPTGMAGVASSNDTATAGGDQAAQLPNIPVPDLPALPKGPTPPAAVIGVLGVPEIMRAASAAQQVEKVIAERREKLNEDAQKEQAAWRDLQGQLASQRNTLPPDQVQKKERELQERITNAQSSFRDRNRIIQEQAQYSLGLIERTLIAVIRQVSESRGMNLVLHRAQVALNVNEFDITEQVTQQMNKVMPSVNMPADGVSPVAQARANAPAAGTPATPAAGTPAAPAAAPPGGTPPARK